MSSNLVRGVREAPAHMSAFSELGLIDPLVRAVEHAGYERPTPIQVQAIPPALDGHDVLGCAQTGTGKTAAFVLPILQRLFLSKTERHDHTPIRVLVLSPTRELTAQIARSFAEYGRFTRIRQIVIFGGVGQANQVAELRRGAEVLVATPGRLNDLLDQGHIDLSHVDTFVLDEVDRMLDQGFLPAVKRILRSVPERRQTLFFSATMPKELEPLAERILYKPVRVAVAPVASTPDRVAQGVHFVEQTQKRSLLTRLLDAPEITRAVVFTRTKHGANRVARHLVETGLEAEAIHGNKSQNARERALSGFRNGTLRVLVATDLAARGIDIDGISHVINFDLPNDPESYVHRIGRTARAGAEGSAISFCSAEERPLLQRIERVIQKRVPVVSEAERTPRRDSGHAPNDAPRAAPANRVPPDMRRERRNQESPVQLARGQKSRQHEREPTQRREPTERREPAERRVSDQQHRANRQEKREPNGQRVSDPQRARNEPRREHEQRDRRDGVRGHATDLARQTDQNAHRSRNGSQHGSNPRRTENGADRSARDAPRRLDQRTRHDERTSRK